MAYGAILGQNPNLSAYAKKEGLPVSDIRELTIRDGESISAGDVVNVGGSPDTIYKDVVPQDNVENMIYNNSVTASDIVKLNDTYSVVCFVISNGAHVMLIDNQTGKVVGSTPSVYSGSASSVSLARLDDSHFVVGYSSSTGTGARIGTVTGASISLGTAKSFAGSEYHLWGFSIISESIMIVFMDGTPGGNLQARVYPYSGNTIGDPLSGPVLSGQQNYASITDLPDDSSGNKRVCICFSDTGDGNKGKAVIATIDSSNAVTWGSVVMFNDVETSYIACCTMDDGNVSVACSAASPGTSPQKEGKVFRLLASDSSVSVGESLSFYPYTPTYIQIVNVGGSIVVTHNYNAFTVQFSSSGIVKGSDFNFNNSFAGNYASAAPISPSQLIVAYADSGNSSYGTTTILEVMGNQIAGSFLDNSQDAIALADGTGGQSIPVGFGGYCECPGVTEGQTIDSSGVSAVAVQDGWLQIKNAWDKGYVTGEYIGTGTYGKNNPTVIDVGFKPSFFAIICNGVIGYYGFSMPGARLVTRPSDNTYCEVKWTDTGLEFYSTQNADYQLNGTREYSYIAWR